MTTILKAATATQIIHDEILNDDAWNGYDGDEVQVANLNQECYYIASRNPTFTVDDVVNEFYSNQMAVAQGLLDVDYFTL